MRVLLVNDLAPGPGSGAEVHLARLAAGLGAAGDDVELFAGEVVHRGAAKILDVWDPGARRRLAARACAFRPDVVHHHNVVRELSSAVLGVPAGVPSVMTVHDNRLLGVGDGTGTGGRGAVLGRAQVAKGRLDRSVARRKVDAVIAVSEHLAEGLRAARFRHVVHLPVFAEPPGPACRVQPVGASHDVVFAGRLVPEKGVAPLIDAFASVAHRHSGARLVVVGDGPQRRELEERAGASGAAVTFTGRLDQAGVQDAMARARAVVVPSLCPEGTPLVAVEAALLGRPLVVSDAPGLRALVTASSGGVVVPPGDVAALAAALDRLLRDAASAADLGEAGRAHALARHTTARVVEETRSVYQRVAR